MQLFRSFQGISGFDAQTCSYLKKYPPRMEFMHILKYENPLKRNETVSGKANTNLDSVLRLEGLEAEHPLSRLLSEVFFYFCFLFFNNSNGSSQLPPSFEQTGAQCECLIPTSYRMFGRMGEGMNGCCCLCSVTGVHSARIFFR
jgi:hypothetical protein